LPIEKSLVSLTVVSVRSALRFVVVVLLDDATG
jgi:hypothetical protein